MWLGMYFAAPALPPPPPPPQICWVPHKHPLLCFRSTPSVPNSFTDGVQITMCNCTLPSSAAIQTGIFPDFTVKEALVFPSHLFSSSVQIFGKPYSHEAKLRCKCSRFTEQSCLCIPSSWGVISILHFANKGVLIFFGGCLLVGVFSLQVLKTSLREAWQFPCEFFLRWNIEYILPRYPSYISFGVAHHRPWLQSWKSHLQSIYPTVPVWAAVVIWAVV